MLPGPVFNVELLTTARRARYFVSRAAYGLILLYLVWQTYQSFTWWGSRGAADLTVRDMAEFAARMFGTVSVAQAVAVLALTPVLVAGTIADEKQRKTLHYLMSSRLTSGEIVLGKLAARLLLVGVYLAVGLPILSLLTLFGGIAPELVVAAYAATASTAFFLAGLSMLISTHARRVRDAILVVYLLELAWLVAPLVLGAPLRYAWPALQEWVEPINEWLYASNPLSLFGTLMTGGRGGPSMASDFAWLVGLQMAFGLLFVALSVWRLRPVFRAQGAEARPVAGRWRNPRAIRFFSRPPVGDDPMLWKELHVVRATGMVRWVVRFLVLIGFAIIAYWLIYLGAPALEELWHHGYGSSGGYGAREELNVFLRVTGTILYVLWGLGLAAAASAGIAAEREEDTWISLLTTLLTPIEILRAKMAGAAWSLRALGAVMLGLWAFGLFAGAIHPVGFVAVLIEWAVFSAFAVALGTSVSLKARNTTRATVASIAVLLFLNGGYLMCCIPLNPDVRGPFLALGSTPFVMAASPISYREVGAFLDPDGSHWREEIIEIALTCFLSVVAYGTAAGLLTLFATSTFDEAADRPRRDPFAQPPPKPPPAVPKAVKALDELD